MNYYIYMLTHGQGKALDSASFVKTVATLIHFRNQLNNSFSRLITYAKIQDHSLDLRTNTQVNTKKSVYLVLFHFPYCCQFIYTLLI